jgi:two-component system cell cycle response regulator
VNSIRVLVVDDCVDEANVLAEGLRLVNYEVSVAYRGVDALERCAKESFDLILLDVGLPDIDGYEICKKIKSNEKTRNAVVIFVTARGEPVDVEYGLSLGAADYITKPYNLPIILVRVESIMRTHQILEYGQAADEYFIDPAYTDALTGLRNRRYLHERLQEEIEKAHRYNYPVSCLFIEVDEVQPVDQETGAQSLDDLLVDVALAMRNNSRCYDILVRYDCTLFAAILPHARREDALSYARKIENQVSSTLFGVPMFPTHTRLSFGVVTFQNGHTPGIERILGEAMRGLLRAKSNPNERIYVKEFSDRS